MEFLQSFSETFISYINALWLPVAFGFLLSGIFYEFIPAKMVERYLGSRGLKPIFLSSLIGTALPICCFGTLPIAVTLRRKGACLGPVLAFLVTTPATSVSALAVSWKLMGSAFTIYIFFAVIILGLVIGIIGNWIRIDEKRMVHSSSDECCHQSQAAEKSGNAIAAKVKGILTYAFITLPKEIGMQLLLGIAVASFIIVFVPIQNFIRQYLIGIWGYMASLAVGLVDYVCSTASVPTANALLKSGMAPGPVMVYLLLGPITSYGMFFVINKEFGVRVLGVYLAVICLMSLILGLGFNFLITHTFWAGSS